MGYTEERVDGKMKGFQTIQDTQERVVENEGFLLIQDTQERVVVN